MITEGLPVNATLTITPTDLLVWSNIVATILGFVILAIKHDRRVTRMEIHLFHIMRMLGMKPRIPADEPEEETRL